MTIWQLICLVAACGAIGGIINCAITGEFVLPKIDPSTKVWRAGWVGNVLVGAIAAVVVCGTNSQFAGEDILTNGALTQKFTLAQLVSNIVVGLGGGNILTQMSQRQADKITKEKLTEALKQ